jgi:hypothetical protein
LVRWALEGPLERGDEAGVLVGDHHLHASQTAVLQIGEEASPEDLVLGVADVEAEDLAAAVGGDSAGDDDGR